MNDIEVILAVEDDDDRDFARLARAFKHLIKKVDLIMADLTGLEKAVADVQASDATAATEIASLAATVKELSAGNVSQAQIDSIAADLETAASKLSEAGAPAPTPAPAPEETPAPAPEEAPAPTPAPEEAPAETPPGEPAPETPAEGQVPSGTVPADENGEPSA